MSTGLQSAEVPINAEELKTVVIKEPFFDERGASNPGVFPVLNEEFGGQFEKAKNSGSGSKETYSNGELIIQTIKGNEIKNPMHWKQIDDQMKFYKRYSTSEAFKNVVVPIKAVIQDENLNDIGTVAEYYGISFEDYRNNGMRTPSGAVVTRASINQFVENYRKLIDETGFPHDDFVFGTYKIGKQEFYNSEPGNIRVGPNGELRFIDYQGRTGFIRYTNEDKRKTEEFVPETDASGHPTDPKYIEHAKGDPARVQVVLETLFRPQQ